MEKDVSDEKKGDKIMYQHSNKGHDTGKDPFRTPVHTPQILKRDFIRSIDSGFSERSDFSSPDVTPSPAESVTESCSNTCDEEKAKSSVIFEDNSFSPVSRIPNSGRSRRASRVSLSTRPPILQIFSSQEEDTENTGGVKVEKCQNEDSENTAGMATEKSEENSIDSSSIKTHLQQGIALPMALLKKGQEFESCSSMSSSTDDLEMSLQEMSLEEFSSSNSTSPVFGIPLVNRFGKTAFPASSRRKDSGHEELSSDSSQHNSDNENDHTILNIEVESQEVEALSSLSISPASSDESCSLGHQDPDSFFTSLSLKQRSFDSTNKLSTDQLISSGQDFKSQLSSHSQLFTNTSIPFACKSGEHSTDSRVPLLPHQYGMMDLPSSSCSFSQPSSSLHLFHIPPACQELLKSPSKRIGSSSNSDQEYAFLRSPTKTRKIQFSSPLKSNSKKVRTPNRTLRERSLFEGKNSSVVRSIFSDHVSDLRSPLVKKKFEYEACHAKPEKTFVKDLNEDEIMHSINLCLQKSPREILRSPPSTPRKLDAKSSQYSPSKLLPRNPQANKKKMNRSPYSSPKKLSNGSPCSSPKKYMNKSPYSSPSKLINRSPRKSPRKLRLEKIIKEFSPRDPSRLIGRFTGAGKFDIVGELSSRDFLHCLQKLFFHLSESDICSICQVNSFWRLAVSKDPISAHRRKLFIIQQRRQMALKGQENSKFKAKDEFGSQAMTSSKGHLTQVQPRATAWRKPSPPSPQKPQRSSMDLLSSDRLRGCPHCQSPAKVLQRQDRAVCSACNFDFCTLCFSAFHGSKRCKPLCIATSSRSDLAGSRKSRKNLRRL